MTDFHSIEMTSITGEPVSLSKYQDNLCLVVNVASR
jgi:glutathione peroxidase-family protein